jgi:hypothetical protein
LVSTVLGLVYDVLSLKNDANAPSKSKSKKLRINLFVDIFKADEEKNRIRIRNSLVQIPGSGSVPKCHGFTTLIVTFF